MPVTCDLVIPCRNEGPALARLLARVPTAFSTIVVDNASDDDTAEVARRWGARVVVEPRPGYGAAVHAGVEASAADLVAVIDGDGSLDPRDLLAMRQAVADGLCRMAVGRRRPIRAGLMPWPSRAGNAFAIAWLRRRGLRVHDIGPARVCRRADLLALGVQDRRFGYPVELLGKAAAAGWRVHEYDVAYAPRAAGTRSKVSGSWRGTVLAATDFLRVMS
jgi:glycosyltransferase involved in cell wall biosynthesis